MRYLFLVLLLSLIASFSYAQHSQEGIVYENKTHVALAGISIQNLNGKNKTATDKLGKFIISAKVSDILVFTGFGYKPDTVVVTDTHAREIYMDPLQHLLNEVEINGKGGVNPTIFQPNKKDPDFHNQTMTYQRNADGSVKGGINLRIWSNKKTENEAKKRETETKNDKISLEIAQAFSKENIATFVPLKGNELQSFIIRYSPDIPTYTSGDFNMTMYVNKCYKEFMKLPPEERQKTSIFGN